ncbi:MAG TPA: NAD-dependent succinate-semialdehyde dehydrogenase [Magnetospirillaceae bacterium]|jgi:succinate-semialdehyde dehydrogenase/glutarate-semialdehyde dehydrogenase
MNAVTDHDNAFLRAIPTGIFVDGAWKPSIDGATMPVIDPASGKPFATVSDASGADARMAIDIAARKQSSWAKLPPRERGEILRRAFQMILDRKEDLARLITLEMGKPLAESRAEVVYAAEFFRWFSEEAVRMSGSWTMAPDGVSRLITMKQPVGPCYLILPWNVPLAMGTRKIGPAVAAGCTMVVKPAEQTPLSMNALAAIMVEAGLPAGVLNVLPTSKPAAVTEEILKDARLRKLSFTGSTAVGRRLVEQSAQGLLRLSMELGGNAPFIVFEDADIDMAVTEAMKAKLRNNGEACTSANRFFVHRSVSETFTMRLKQKFESLIVGPGLHAETTLGPLINQKAVDKVDRLVRSALEDGAKIAYAGSAPKDGGYYYPPTILSGVSAAARIVKEEIFGPVAPIVAFDKDEDAITWANDSEYGLSSYIFTRDIARGLRVTEALEVGMVGINKGVISNPAAPFGGIKSSGFGREGGAEGINEYIEVKYLAVDG